MYTQPWLINAEKYKGLAEKSGPGSNPEILRFAAVVGGAVAKDYISDDIPWCGLFVAFIMAQTGIVPVDNPLWALNWAKFGTKLDKARVGAIAVFKRNGGGHVGFVVGETGDYYLILGGNQGDAVNIKQVEKARCVALRWPTGMEKFLVDETPTAKPEIIADVKKTTKET